jgi:hypothetical protein
VGSLERRLQFLEGWAEARGASPAKVEEARQEREWTEVLSRLPRDDLFLLEDVLTAACECWEASGTFENLGEVVDERGLRAFARYEEVLEAVRREGAL